MSTQYLAEFPRNVLVTVHAMSQFISSHGHNFSHDCSHTVSPDVPSMSTQWLRFYFKASPLSPRKVHTASMHRSCRSHKAALVWTWIVPARIHAASLLEYSQSGRRLRSGYRLYPAPVLDVSSEVTLHTVRREFAQNSCKRPRIYRCEKRQIWRRSPAPPSCCRSDRIGPRVQPCNCISQPFGGTQRQVD